MAIIADDQDKLNQDPNAQAQQQGAPGISSGGPTTVSGGQSSSDVGGAVSTAGVGAGGTGGWTNIQAYLDANKGDTGSAQALDKTVTGQLDAEKNAYTQDSSKFLNEAKSKVATNKIDNSKADELLNQATGLYSYGASDNPKNRPLSYGDTGQTRLVKTTPGGATPPDATAQTADPDLKYEDVVGKMKHALTDTYSGPREYNYAIGNQAAEYGANLNDNQGFDGLMKHIYQKAAPGGLSSGQTELQKQLDVNNTGLVDKRKELQGKYSELTAGRDKTVADTTAGLSALQDDYGANQRNLQSYLGKKSNDYDTKVKQAEADARAAYNNTYTNDQTGKASVGWDEMTGDTDYWRGAIATRQGIDAYSNNLTWKQMQNEQSNREYNWKTGRNTLWYGGEPEFDQRLDELNNFYGEQDKKYGNTADQEERSFNALQDFLNTGAAKREQGFKVGG